MSIVVENGTGLPTSNAYASVAEADAYFVDRGNTTWEDAEADAKAQALVRATAALDGIYGGRWPGLRLTQAQALDWPRGGAMDRDGYHLTAVPAAVKAATFEAALIELGSSGSLSPSLDRGGSVIREKVGPIETEYAAGASAFAVHAAVNHALARVINAGSLKMVRA